MLIMSYKLPTSSRQPAMHSLFEPHGAACKNLSDLCMRARRHPLVGLHVAELATCIPMHTAGYSIKCKRVFATGNTCLGTPQGCGVVQVSSVHMTFNSEEEWKQAASCPGWLSRMGVQFHWENNGYKCDSSAPVFPV